MLYINKIGFIKKCEYYKFDLNFIKLSRGLANFSKVPKFLQYILHQHCSTVFSWGPRLIIHKTRISYDLKLLGSVVALSILKNSPLSAAWNISGGVLFDSYVTQAMEIEVGYFCQKKVKISSGILIWRFKSDITKGDLSSFINTSSVGYISGKSFLNSSSSFVAVKW